MEINRSNTMFGKNKTEKVVENEGIEDVLELSKAPAAPNSAEKDAEVPQFYPLTEKDQKALHKAHYETKKDSFPNEYVIANKRTRQIAQLRAFSSTHAANLIGWRPRQIVVLQAVKNIDEAIKQIANAQKTQDEQETSQTN